MLENFKWLLCQLLIFSPPNELFLKDLSGTLCECQIDWVQIKTDVISVLTWHVGTKLFAKVTSRLQPFRNTTRGSTSGTCADPESFVRGGPKATFFSVFFCFFFFFFVLFFFVFVFVFFLMRI